MSDSDKIISQVVEFVADQMGAAGIELEGHHSIQIVGSLWYADKTTSDADVVVERDFTDADILALVSRGWHYDGSMSHLASDYFISLTQYLICSATEYQIRVNLLCYKDKEDSRKLVEAAEVCRFIHKSGVVLPKSTVVGIHEMLMAGLDSEGALQYVRKFSG